MVDSPVDKARNVIKITKPVHNYLNNIRTKHGCSFDFAIRLIIKEVARKKTNGN